MYLLTNYKHSTQKTYFLVSSGCSNISHFEVVTAKNKIKKDSISEAKNAYNRTDVIRIIVLKPKLFIY